MHILAAMNAAAQLSSHSLIIHPTVLHGSLAVALVLGACGGDSDNNPDAAPPDAAPEMTVADARALPSDSTVTIEGYVTVEPGTFASATSEQGFALQDETAGIYVTMSERAELTLSARVRVTGTLAQMNQQTVIMADLASVTALAGTQVVAPRPVTTAEVGEAVEGLLVTVSGPVTQAVQDDAPYGQKAFLDDGSGETQVFVHFVDGVPVIDTGALAEGTMIEVTGLGAQYEATYEVNPRKADDLIIVQ